MVILPKFGLLELSRSGLVTADSNSHFYSQMLIVQSWELISWLNASKRQVLERASMKPLSSPVMSIADPTVASVFKLAPDVSSLLKEFPAAWEPRQPGQLLGHKVEHVIETEGQPLFARAKPIGSSEVGDFKNRVS